VTIWYDFTTSQRSNGRNGIANTEWRLGSALLEVTSGTRCFALRGGSLVEFDSETILRQVGTAGSPSSSILVRPVSTWRRVVLERVVAGLGGDADAVLTVLRSNRARFASGRARAERRARALVERLATRPSLDRAVSADDVIVSVGADWSGELTSALAELKRSTGCRVVTMVYDLIPLTHTHLAFHKDRQLFERYYTNLLAVSDLVTCISEQTRRDLEEFAGARPIRLPPVEVLRLGDGQHLPAPVAAPSREDFFLWVGTIERRKNLDLLYDALRILESEGADLPRVVVVGATGWGVSDLLDEIGLQSTRASRSLALLGAVDDDMLSSLYRRARALLYPSHYEGWGLPVREAAVCGCPVAAGDCPAVREALVGYRGATLLPVDDPVPWAEFMKACPPITEPAVPHTWTQSAQSLEALLKGKMGTRLSTSAAR